MSRSHKYIYKHMCKLKVEDQYDFLTLSPYATRFDRFSLYIKNLITIADTHEARYFFRSTTAILKEKNRHLSVRKYRHIIHPLSRLFCYQKTLMFFLWLICFTVEPFVGSLSADSYLKEDSGQIWVEILMSLLNIALQIDIVCRCFTGYIVSQTKEVVLDQRRIMKNYLITYFFIDFIPVVSSVVLLVFPFIKFKTQLIIFSFKYIRFCRIKTMLDNFNDLLKLLNFGDSFRTFAVGILLAILLMHWCSCLLALVYIFKQAHGFSVAGSWVVQQYYQEEQHAALDFGHQKKSTRIISEDHYQHFLEMVLCHFYGAGYGYYRTRDGTEMFVLALILMTGLFFNILAAAYLLQHFGTVNISELKFDEFMVQAKQYMHNHDLPLKLRKQIYVYYNLKFQQKFFSEQRILVGLSEHLRMEVLLHSCRNLILQVPIFKELSKAAIGSMLSMFQQEIFLPKQEIMNSEEDRDRLYFIVNGTCMVQTVFGAEAMHIEDGDYFGEIELKEGSSFLKVYYRIVALEMVEVFSIRKSDLQYCCSHYPEIAKKLAELAKMKLKWNTVLISTKNEYDRDDIIGELRKGHILSQGNKRRFYLDADN